MESFKEISTTAGDDFAAKVGFQNSNAGQQSGFSNFACFIAIAQ